MLIPLRRAVTVMPLGLRVAAVMYLCLRLPLLLLVAAVFNHPPYGLGQTGMPAHEPSFADAWLRWDSGWYLRIAEQGYDYIVPHAEDCQSSVAFYPLYPLLARALSWSGMSTGASMLCVANAATLLGLWGLHALCTMFVSPTAARNAVALALLLPGSLFFTAGYSEGVFLCVAAWACVFFERRALRPLALCTALAVVSRSHGIMLAGALGLGALLAHDVRRMAAITLGGTVSLTAHLGYQWRTFGEPLAFIKARACWGVSEGRAVARLSDYAAHAWRDALRADVPAFLDLASALWLLVSGMLVWRRFGARYGLFVLSILATMLQAGQLWGMGRIAISAFPAFMWLGEWTASGSRWRTRLLLASCTVLLFDVAARFVHGSWVA